MTFVLLTGLLIMLADARALSRARWLTAAVCCFVVGVLFVLQAGALWGWALVQGAVIGWIWFMFGVYCLDRGLAYE